MYYGPSTAGSDSGFHRCNPAASTRGRLLGCSGDWRAIYVIHKGDEKYIQRAFCPVHSAVSQNICISRKATSGSGPLVYTQHGPQASHWNTISTTSDFISQLAGVQTFVKVPGWSCQFIQSDILHIFDLALVPEASACCLVELLEGNTLGAGSPDDKL